MSIEINRSVSWHGLQVHPESLVPAQGTAIAKAGPLTNCTHPHLYIVWVDVLKQSSNWMSKCGSSLELLARGFILKAQYTELPSMRPPARPPIMITLRMAACTTLN